MSGDDDDSDYHRYDGDHFKMLLANNMLMTFFCMLVTFQSVTSIIICQNVVLVTDMLCWRHEIPPDAKFDKIFPSLNRS